MYVDQYPKCSGRKRSNNGQVGSLARSALAGCRRADRHSSKSASHAARTPAAAKAPPLPRLPPPPLRLPPAWRRVDASPIHERVECNTQGRGGGWAGGAQPSIDTSAAWERASALRPHALTRSPPPCVPGAVLAAMGRQTRVPVELSRVQPSQSTPSSRSPGLQTEPLWRRLRTHLRVHTHAQDALDACSPHAPLALDRRLETHGIDDRIVSVRRCIPSSFPPYTQPTQIRSPAHHDHPGSPAERRPHVGRPSGVFAACLSFRQQQPRQEHVLGVITGGSRASPAAAYPGEPARCVWWRTQKRRGKAGKG